MYKEAINGKNISYMVSINAEVQILVILWKKLLFYLATTKNILIKLKVDDTAIDLKTNSIFSKSKSIFWLFINLL